MRVLIAAGFTQSLINFRYDLIKEIRNLGHDVFAAGPEPMEGNDLSDIGVTFLRTPMARQSANPLADMKLTKRYRELMKEVRPDVALCYTIKPNVYAAPEAKKAGARVFTMVTGIGNAFVSAPAPGANSMKPEPGTDGTQAEPAYPAPGTGDSRHAPDANEPQQAPGIKRRLVRAAAIRLYRKSAAASDRVIFQNPDDIDDFIQFGILRPDERDGKTALVSGSGVNMTHFTRTPLPEKPVFLLAARLLREKGVIEYLDAAREVKKRIPEAECLLAGPFEGADWALNMNDLEPFIADGSIVYLGEIADMRAVYERASVYVLPSYREGTPRTVLEAMSCGIAVITSDAPGCRETVLSGETGLLVPPANANALADAMTALGMDMNLVRAMGEKGHKYCKEKYEVGKVNQAMLDIMGLK